MMPLPPPHPHSSSLNHSAVLAHFMLNERLNGFGVIGCLLCVTGSMAIVLHAPEERQFESIPEIWALAMQPAFLLYLSAALAATLLLILKVPAETAASTPLVPVAICSIVGSLSVVACKALGVAIKLTARGANQFAYAPTWVFAAVVLAAVLTQMAYLNRALDLFNTAVVTPLYYAAFTSLTLLASAVMFRPEQGPADALTQLSGFVTILCGTTLLHATKDLDASAAAGALGRPLGGGGGYGAGADDGLEMGGGSSSSSKKLRV